VQDADASCTHFVATIHCRIAAVLAHPRCELDSHVDTCVAGSNTLLISQEDLTVSVSGSDILIACVATLYEDPTLGKQIMLIINQALYFGKRLPSMLLNPNQMHAHGILVDDVP